MADKKEASPLSYFASQIDPEKPHWFETPEGFRIYRDVPIARTGVQEYAGHELKKHPSYDPEWNLDDDTIYPVHRDVDEVTSPETIASFEGKSATDGHPPGGDLWLHTYSDGKYSRGHAQNVRVGEPLENGDVPLLADLHVKDSELNDKIDAGQREVSAGYTYKLSRDASGRLSQKEIRGNHVASVPKGRAGRDIAIVDAALPKQLPVAPPKRKETRMAAKSIKGWLLKLAATSQDAEPEDIEKVSNLLAEKEAEKQEKEPTVVKKDGSKEAAKDEEQQPEWAKALMTRLEKLMPEEKKAEADEEPMPAWAKELCAKVAALEGKKAEGDEDGDEGEKPEAEEVEGDDAEEVEGGKTLLPESEAVGDSAAFLKAIAPMMAKTKDAKLQAGYRKALKSVRVDKPGAAGDADPLKFLTHPGAATAAADAEVSPSDFFRGKTFAEGMRAYNEHLATKGAK